MQRSTQQNKNNLTNTIQGYYVPVKRICPFCKRGIVQVDHKEADVIKRFTNSFGRINPARRTKACAKHQRLLAQALKRARFLALISFVN